MVDEWGGGDVGRWGDGQGSRARGCVRGALGRVEWFVDNQPVGLSLGTAPLAWPLARGRHTVRAEAVDGTVASVEILVK